MLSSNRHTKFQLHNIVSIFTNFSQINYLSTYRKKCNDEFISMYVHTIIRSDLQNDITESNKKFFKENPKIRNSIKIFKNKENLKMELFLKISKCIL